MCKRRDMASTKLTIIELTLSAPRLTLPCRQKINLQLKLEERGKMKNLKRAFLILICLTAPNFAGAADYTTYQKDVMEPYGFYKKSLALTSKKDNRDKAIHVTENFIDSWGKIVAKYQGDPPQEFQQISEFQAKLNRPVAVGQEALVLLKDGKVAEAHSALEEVRYLLWRMRIDAGIVSLNDKINDFHEAMEIILDGASENKGAAHLQHVGHRYGAWVALKWEDIAGVEYTAEDRAVFEKAVAAGRDAIAGLRDALKKGDSDLAKKSGAMVKKAYKAIFFLPACS